MTNDERLSRDLTQAFRRYNLKRHWILNNTHNEADIDEMLDRLVKNYNKIVERIYEKYDEYINESISYSHEDDDTYDKEDFSEEEYEC